MGFASKAVTVATMTGLMVGAMTYLDPVRKSPEQVRDQVQQQQVDNLSDAQERNNEQKRQAGDAQADAERQQKLTPGEPRPPEGKPKLKPKLPLRP